MEESIVIVWIMDINTEVNFIVAGRLRLYELVPMNKFE